MENKIIHKHIYNISELQRDNDYIKLKFCSNKELNLNSLVGNKFINYYTSFERLDTKSRRGISFYELYKNKDEHEKINSIGRLVEMQKLKNPNVDIHKIWYNIFKLYYGSISIFKPILSIDIYRKFNPNTVLDFCMGWGGRLIGACVLDIPKYIGIDLNVNLTDCYNEMISRVKYLGTNTDIELFFEDSLSIDYSKLNYDMVFTSPPYYNIEIYNGTLKKTKRDWNENFYKPIFKKTYQYLSVGGYFILNIPTEIYENICIILFGQADEIIPLNKKKRNNDYKEYIYVWRKKIELNFELVEEF